MVRQTKRFKKGLNKKVLSAILAASMIMTSSSFAFAAPVDGSLSDDTATATEANAPSNEEAGIATLSELGAEDATDVLADKTAEDLTYELEGETSYTCKYNGKAQKPDVVVKDGKEEVPSSQYKVEYYNNVNANASTEDTDDDPYVKISFISGNYSGQTHEVKFTIEQADISSATVKWGTEKAFVYDGKVHYPEVKSATVELEGVDEPYTLTADDYEVGTYEGGEIVGDNYAVNATQNDAYAVTLVGKGNFTGHTSKSPEFVIDRADIAQADVTVTVDQVVYKSNLTKEDITKGVKVVENTTEKELVKGADYFIQFRDKDGEWTSEADALPDEGRNIGVHDLRIVAKNESGNYKENSYIDTTYEVVASSLSTAVKGAEVVDFEDGKSTYTGENQFPEDIETALTIPSGLKYGLDYEITNAKEEWVNAGEYTLNLKGLNEYAGQTATVTVEITPKYLNADKTNVNPDGITLTVVQGTHPSGNVSSVNVTITDTISNEKVTLEEGKDYTFEVTKEATKDSPNGKVEITGIGNYSTALNDDITVLEKGFVLEDKMPINDPSISVDYLGDYVYNGDKIVLDQDDFKVVETDGSNTYTLTDEDFSFVGDSNEYVNEAGEVTVTIQGNGKYFGTLRLILKASLLQIPLRLSQSKIFPWMMQK